MKTLVNPQARVPIFALTAVLLLLSSLETWTHAAAPATYSSDLLITSEGDLDPSFGTGGKLSTDFFNSADLAQAVAIQPDGRIIVVGGAADTDDLERYDFALVRYNSDGSLDNSFGIGGKVTTDFMGFLDIATAVALYPDGRIVVVGFVDHDNDEDSDFGVARYNSDGSLDTTFDNDGKVITGFFGFDNHASAVAIQPDDKIVVAGVVGRLINDTGPEFGLVRYNIDGSLDTSFGTNGKALTDFFGSIDDAQTLVLQPDGKFIVAGDVVNLPANTNHDFGLARYNSDGTLDASFGISGKVTTDFFGSSDIAKAIALQPDGRIVTAGFVIGSGTRNYEFGLARYKSDGSLDSSFGNNGKVVTDFAGERDEANALIIQPDGKIIAGGRASTSRTTSLVGLARYNSNGSLDSSFGFNGKMTSNFFGQINTANAMAMQIDGKLIVAGTTQKDENTYDIALLRCFAFTPPDFNLELNEESVQASRGKKAKVNVGIGRVGGFTGNVTVSVSDTSAFGIKVSPNPASTTESKIKFKLKIKSSAQVATRQVTFTGRDDTGRERSVTLAVIVQ